jgi:hypothetical protein
MNAFGLVKMFVAVVVHAGLITAIMTCVVHYRISVSFTVDRLSSNVHHHHCTSRLSGRTTSLLQQLTGPGSAISSDQPVTAGPDQTVEPFLVGYEAYCQMNVIPKASNIFVVPAEFGQMWASYDCLCPCIPSGLGTLNVFFSAG